MARAQRVLQRVAQWLWIEHPTFPLRSRHFTIELMPPYFSFASAHFQHFLKAQQKFLLHVIELQTLCDFQTLRGVFPCL